ncbi:MAG: DUF6266 family protein [Methylococcaceae bacterium]
MATNEKGILGGFSGKVGTVIGGSWNGVDYMRGIASEISNPQTEKQQNQRAKVATMVRFLRPMTNILRVGFKKQAVKMSAFNAATSYNLSHAINGFYPDFEIDYSKVMVSQGKLPGAINPQVSCPAGGKMKFTWQDNSSEKGAMPDDRALLVVYDQENGKVITEMKGNLRASQSQVITLPSSFEGAEVHCYLAFQNANQTVISDSRYAGEIVVK